MDLRFFPFNATIYYLIRYTQGAGTLSVCTYITHNSENDVCTLESIFRKDHLVWILLLYNTLMVFLSHSIIAKKQFKKHSRPDSHVLLFTASTFFSWLNIKMIIQSLKWLRWIKNTCICQRICKYFKVMVIIHFIDFVTKERLFCILISIAFYQQLTIGDELSSSIWFDGTSSPMSIVFMATNIR